MEPGKEKIDYELIDKWIAEYRKSNNKYKKSKYRALIVTTLLPIVKRIARTIARRSYDPIEDMVQAGSIGLLKAIDSYNTESNVLFQIYAGHIIIGEMRHYLRDKLNTIRVPRHIQELMFRINSFISTLTPEELYDLTSSDVAQALNVPKEVVDFAIQADRRTSVISLEDIYNSHPDDNLGFEEIIAKDDYKETAEIEDARLVLKNVIQKLPDDCRQVVELYYYKDMTQTEISDELSLTKMSVSRKLKKAFSILYKMIASKEDNKAASAQE